MTAEVDALDISPLVLAEARSLVGRAIRLVEGDARSLPFEDGTYDVVLCCWRSTTFPQSRPRRSWRKCGVCEARGGGGGSARSYPGYAGAWLATRTVARNRLTQHDAPVSVLSSYRSPELRIWHLELECAPLGCSLNRSFGNR